MYWAASTGAVVAALAPGIACWVADKHTELAGAEPELGLHMMMQVAAPEQKQLLAVGCLTWSGI